MPDCMKDFAANHERNFKEKRHPYLSDYELNEIKLAVGQLGGHLL